MKEYHFRIPESLGKKLHKIAKQNGRSGKKEAEIAVRSYVLAKTLTENP